MHIIVSPIMLTCILDMLPVIQRLGVVKAFRT